MRRFEIKKAPSASGPSSGARIKSILFGLTLGLFAALPACSSTRPVLKPSPVPPSPSSATVAPLIDPWNFQGPTCSSLVIPKGAGEVYNTSVNETEHTVTYGYYDSTGRDQTVTVDYVKRQCRVRR